MNRAMGSATQTLRRCRDPAAFDGHDDRLRGHSSMLPYARRCKFCGLNGTPHLAGAQWSDMVTIHLNIAEFRQLPQGTNLGTPGNASEKPQRVLGGSRIGEATPMFFAELDAPALVTSHISSLETCLHATASWVHF